MADEEDYKDAPSLGPCVGCGGLGETVEHTVCECDLESCVKAICDGCRFGGGQWAWIDGGHPDDTREMYSDCAERMERTKNRHKAERQKAMGSQS